MSAFKRQLSAIVCLGFLLTFLPPPSQAGDIVNKISARLTKALITEGQFKQIKRLKFLQQPLISTGIFTYHQDKGVIWTTLTPVSSQLVLDESHMVGAEGEQNLPAAFGKVFKALLGGEFAKLSENFTITGHELANSWQLQLNPKDDLLRKIIADIELHGDHEVRWLEMAEAGGNVTRIEFVNLSHPARLSQEQQADFERLSP